MNKEGNLIFLGTGSSDGIPRVSCLTNPNKICEVCESAKDPDSKNRRRNQAPASDSESNQAGRRQKQVSRCWFNV